MFAERSPARVSCMFETPVEGAFAQQTMDERGGEESCVVRPLECSHTDTRSDEWAKDVGDASTGGGSSTCGTAFHPHVIYGAKRGLDFPPAASVGNLSICA